MKKLSIKSDVNFVLWRNRNVRVNDKGEFVFRNKVFSSESKLRKYFIDVIEKQGF